MIRSINLNRRYVVLFIISSLVTCKAYYAYFVFHQHNLPVYDGIMYERNQILSFFRFQNHFSFIDQIYQAIIEFNGPNGGFGALIALINPKWFINDWDIIIRSFVAVFIFCAIIFKLLEKRVTEINRYILLFAIFQLPMFYHFRIGLTTYVPDITSGLFLISGYLAIYIFYKFQQIRYLILGLVLVIVSFLFRLNFFVYATALIFPLIIVLYFNQKNIFTQKLKWTSFIIVSISILFSVLYVSKHFDFFISYYTKPVAFQKTGFVLSLKSVFDNYLNEVGISGSILLIGLSLLVNRNKTITSNIDKAVLMYPFAFFSLFLIFYLHAVNQPHVFSAFFVCSLPLFFIGNGVLKSKVSTPIIYVILIISFVFLIANYFKDIKTNSLSDTNFSVSQGIIEHIISKKELNKNFKYVCFYDEMIDVPMDVSILNKTGIWLNSQTKFYFHDWNYYDLDPHLNSEKISRMYIDKLKTEKFDLIAINTTINPKMKNYPTAIQINRNIYSYLQNSKSYHKLTNCFESPKEGKVILFEKNEY